MTIEETIAKFVFGSDAASVLGDQSLVSRRPHTLAIPAGVSDDDVRRFQELLSFAQKNGYVYLDKTYWYQPGGGWDTKEAE